jgi:heat shock protein HtpX
MSTPPSGDRPLSGLAYVMLLAGAGATMLLFYFFAVGSILLLLVILAVEFVVFLVLARFGAIRLLVPTMQRHGTLLTIFFRSMWLGKSAEFRIPIKAEDAPELRSILKKICQQAEVPLPRKVYLQMGVNAWVQMKGYRRGAGTTILGIGYDLLAGLSQVEMEAVLAHEMMHAKLVERGFRQLLTGGIRRSGQLTNKLAVEVANGRRAKRSDNLVGFFMRGAHSLTRMAARQVAACSRQDEFAADRGAAELCGAGAIRSSLLKLEDLNRIASRLPLRERIAQLESGGGFGEWLVNELAAANATSPTEVKTQAFNQYSTHPSLHDRLAALSTFADQTLTDSPPALGLLAHPDEVAEKLVRAIQKEIIKQEQHDSKQLDRWSRKAGTARNLQPMQVLGMFVGVAGLIGGIVTAAASIGLGIFLALTLIAAGIAMLKYGGYQEKLALPVPDFALIKTTSLKKLEVKPEQVKAIEAELHNSIEERKRAEKVSILLEQSYQALGQCDYVRAHVAARLCLEQEKKSIPGTLALAVAAGGLKQGVQVGRALHFVQRNTGMKGKSSAWGAGWSLALVGDWVHAEAFLEQARTKIPEAPTVLALLAISQARRGKLFTAIESARKAFALAPTDKEYAKLLIDLLLQGGFLREVRDLLQQWVNEAVTDTEMTIAMVKLCLLQRDEATAQAWIEFIRQSEDSPKKFVTLGEACEAARRDAWAEENYQTALTNGHYPEALLGLGRLEASRQNRDQAGAYFRLALDLDRPLGENSVGPIPLVVPILQQLKMLQEPILNCRAWIASFPGKVEPAALAGVSFLIYAPNSDEAKKSLNTILSAMQPGVLPSQTVSWKTAPKEQQPDGPVYPGIQAVIR